MATGGVGFGTAEASQTYLSPFYSPSFILFFIFYISQKLISAPLTIFNDIVVPSFVYHRRSL